MRRSLIMAGGGLKVAFQAGVLQVWLDEANIKFDHADGASGGCFNLAMYAQGMTGRKIADNWRALAPIDGLSFNWAQYERLFFARSMFTLDNYRRKVFPGWASIGHRSEPPNKMSPSTFITSANTASKLSRPLTWMRTDSAPWCHYPCGFRQSSSMATPTLMPSSSPMGMLRRRSDAAPTKSGLFGP